MSANVMKSIRSLILASNILAPLVENRVYSLAAPPDAAGKNRIVIHRISSEHEHHLTGIGHLASPRLQLDIWAQTVDEVEQIIDGLRVGIFKFRGTVEGLEIQDLIFGSITHRAEPPTSGAPLGSFGAIVELVVWHTESPIDLVKA